MSMSHRTRRRNQVMLALNLVLFITYSIVMIMGNRPFYSWLILFVLAANILTHTIILRSR